MFQIVRACLEFSPYTHFYTQVLIDIIVKTIFRGELRHTVVQERIRIRTNGNIEQRYKKII